MALKKVLGAGLLFCLLFCLFDCHETSDFFCYTLSHDSLSYYRCNISRPLTVNWTIQHWAKAIFSFLRADFFKPSSNKPSNTKHLVCNSIVCLKSFLYKKFGLGCSEWICVYSQSLHAIYPRHITSVHAACTCTLIHTTCTSIHTTCNLSMPFSHYMVFTTFFKTTRHTCVGLLVDS